MAETGGPCSLLFSVVDLLEKSAAHCGSEFLMVMFRLAYPESILRTLLEELLGSEYPYGP